MVEQHIPYMAKSVLSFGNLVLSIDRDSMKTVDYHYEYRDTIATAKGSPVSTSIFENKEYSGISAVLYSAMNIINRPNIIGVEIYVVHNPIAYNKLPLGIFPLGTEWWVENHNLVRKDHDEGQQKTTIDI